MWFACDECGEFLSRCIILTGFPGSSCIKLNWFSQMSIKFHLLSSSAYWNGMENFGKVLKYYFAYCRNLEIFTILHRWFGILRIHSRYGTSSKLALGTVTYNAIILFKILSDWISFKKYLGETSCAPLPLYIWEEADQPNDSEEWAYISTSHILPLPACALDTTQISPEAWVP